MGGAALAGYTGRVTEVSPICFSDPGMSNANMQFAVVDVDADASENADINPELEVRESFCTHRTLLPISQRPNRLVTLPGVVC